ncbi:MAG: hypothetical protein KDD01_01920, partial [Phaeodactylibacter sp.]|nr:hypothetical protein [Phaeodactylibacter sp.]
MAQKDPIYILFCLLLFFSLPLSLAAADINRDSLIQALKKVPEKSEARAKILQQLSKSYREDAPDES